MAMVPNMPISINAKAGAAAGAGEPGEADLFAKLVPAMPGSARAAATAIPTLKVQAGEARENEEECEDIGGVQADPMLTLDPPALLPLVEMQRQAPVHANLVAPAKTRRQSRPMPTSIPCWRRTPARRFCCPSRGSCLRRPCARP
jgi:hypothetical protein